MYQHIKFDDCGTYSIKEMELNAKSNQLNAKSNQSVQQKNIGHSDLYLIYSCSTHQGVSAYEV